MKRVQKRRARATRALSNNIIDAREANDDDDALFFCFFIHVWHRDKDESFFFHLWRRSARKAMDVNFFFFIFRDDDFQSQRDYREQQNDASSAEDVHDDDGSRCRRQTEM